MSSTLKLDNKTGILKIDTNASLSQPKKLERFMVFNDLNPMLNQIMPEFDFSNPSVNPVEFAQRMKLTMREYGGIGLAANQCGINIRMFVIGTENEMFVCYNPKVISKSENCVSGNEGCLSFPGMFLNIKRPEIIDVEYMNERGETVKNTFSGVTARCFQHELDHLNGIKFTNYVGKTSMIMAKKRKEKIKKKIIREKF